MMANYRLRGAAITPYGMIDELFGKTLQLEDNCHRVAGHI